MRSRLEFIRWRRKPNICEGSIEQLDIRETEQKIFNIYHSVSVEYLLLCLPNLSLLDASLASVWFASPSDALQVLLSLNSDLPVSHPLSVTKEPRFGSWGTSCSELQVLYAVYYLNANVCNSDRGVEFGFCLNKKRHCLTQLIYIVMPKLFGKSGQELWWDFPSKFCGAIDCLNIYVINLYYKTKFIDCFCYLFSAFLRGPRLCTFARPRPRCKLSGPF